MKKALGFKWLTVLALVLTFLLTAHTVSAQESDTPQAQESDTAQAPEEDAAQTMQGSEPTIDTAVICESVADRQPVNEGTSFSADVGRLYCFTKIVGAETPVQVFHVWYYGDVERARVALNVKGSSWRTYSSKIIQAHEIGAWKVDILGPDGTVLQTVSFEITQ